MKTKSFKDYLDKRLDKDEIAKIEAQAELEIKILRSIQEAISNAVTDYMNQHDVGFNELVKRLDSSPSHVAKIQKGEANLTLASVAHLFAMLGEEPHLVFRKK